MGLRPEVRAKAREIGRRELPKGQHWWDPEHKERILQQVYTLHPEFKPTGKPRKRQKAAPKRKRETPSGVECPICWEAVPLGTTGCGHLLCATCFEQLPQKKCPSCRKIIGTFIPRVYM